MYLPLQNSTQCNIIFYLFELCDMLDAFTELNVCLCKNNKGAHMHLLVKNQHKKIEQKFY